MHQIKHLQKLSVLLLSLFLLSSCNDSITYEYLMQHPKILVEKYKKCQESDTPECKMVRLAGNDFGALVDEMNHDPELFGQRIMQVQTELLLLSKACLTAKSGGDVNKIKIAADAYLEQLNMLKNLYAVVGIRAPE